MSSIKVVDVNENEEAKQEETPIQNEEEAQIQNEEGPKNQTILNTETEIPKQNEEPKPETLKNNSKTEKLKDKMITCPKCSKTMQLRNYRYKHEKTCSGAIESKPIKPKAKAKPKPIPQPAQEEEQETPHKIPPWKNKQPAVQPLQPVNSLAQHYQLLQNEYIKQKQENTVIYVKICLLQKQKKMKY